MEILLLTANDPTDPTGGGQRTLNRQVANVARNGHEVSVFTYGRPAGEATVDGFPFYRTPDTFPKETVEEYVCNGSFDLILAQSGWADLALWVGGEYDVPVVLDAASTFDLTVDSGVAEGLEPDHVFVPSEFLESEAREAFDAPVTVTYPVIDFEYYAVEDQTRDRHTLVNPIDSKGGFLFKRLASRNPEKSFLAKMGWFLFRDDDGSWDPDMFEIIDETFPGETPVPDEPDFESTANVEFVREGDIRDIYRRTEVLLVPSQAPESFGRVVVEAMWNGIPVVASNQSGIPEACGDAGILVDDYQNVEAWERALSRLEDEATYERQVELGERRAKAYRENQPKMLDRFRRVLERTS